jgi:hypothetical protein
MRRIFFILVLLCAPCFAQIMQQVIGTTGSGTIIPGPFNSKRKKGQVNARVSGKATSVPVYGH